MDVSESRTDLVTCNDSAATDPPVVVNGVDGWRVTLLHSCHEERPTQDFEVEVRPAIDASCLTNDAALLLDVAGADLDDIVEQMLAAVIDKNELGRRLSVTEAKASLLLRDRMFSRTLRGVGTEDDHPWLCAMGEPAGLDKRCVAIARLRTPVDLGLEAPGLVQLLVLVLCPLRQKGTKTALETGLTFATLLTDVDFRQRLLAVQSEVSFQEAVALQAAKLATRREKESPAQKRPRRCTFLSGIREDFVRRLAFYKSDFVDGVRGPGTIPKVISTTLFLYFACLLPSIAFASLNDKNTKGQLNVQKFIVGQAFGGVFFALLGGQPLLILLTTAPLALYTRTVYDISVTFQLDFFAFFACVGLWNSFFLLLYAVADASKVMRWCTRSTEEVFALFITIAFFVDAFGHVSEDFERNYFAASCSSNATSPVDDAKPQCNRASSVLYLLLMLGTLWLGMFLYNFRKTPFLRPSWRSAVTDYSLVVAVLFVSFLASFVFRQVQMDRFRFADDSLLRVAPLETLPTTAIFAGMALGFCLSLLFFMDQNISAAMVNNPSNKLQKGSAYHYDLLVVAALNGILSVLCCPWMHAAIPHCPLHARSLADVEERVDGGVVSSVVTRARETRLAALVAHVLIGLSVFLLPYPLAYIPNAVLDGLFLYVAITGLFGNQMFERVLLLVTEQVTYPPNHYVRRVPQRSIHLFTACQLLQLGLLSLSGFFPCVYVKMAFPVVLFALLPVRSFVVPRLLDRRTLQALDAAEHH